MKITGKDAYVLCEPSTSGVWDMLPSTNEWTLDLSISEIDVTTFKEGGVSWKDFLYSLQEWTATVNGFIDTTAIPKLEIGHTSLMIFQISGNNMIMAPATLVGNNLGLNVDDAGSESLSFRGVNTFTIASNESESRGDFSDWNVTDTSWSIVSNELIYDGLADGSAILSGVLTINSNYIVLIKSASTATGSPGYCNIGGANIEFNNIANKWAVVDCGEASNTNFEIKGKAADGPLAISDVIIYEVIK